MELTHELVTGLFNYHEDGKIYWKVSGRGRRLDLLAGVLHKHKSGNRYYTVINGKMFANARIIFLWHNGFLPEMVDHKDLNKLNDRIENLRAATRSQNGTNKKSAKGSSSKYLGVTKSKYGYRVYILSNKVSFYLGCFKNEDDAGNAYNEAAKKYHGEFANLNEIS